MNLDKRISVIAKAGEDKKAFDISVLDVRGLSSVADYFIILSGNSTRQVVSIAEEIEYKMTKEGENPLNKDGHNTGKWILLDYENIIVHVFEKDEREFYDLERLWIDSKTIDIEDILIEEE